MIGNQIAGLYGSPYVAPTGNFESISTVTLSSSATSMEFSSIPNTYKHLQIRWLVRSTTGGTAQDEVQLRMGNGSIDTAGNYSYSFIYGNGGSAVGSYQDNQGQIRAGFAPRASATANAFGVAIVDVLDYANVNKYKSIRSIAGADLNDTNGLASFCTGGWRSTSAVTNIRITPESGNSFPQYSQFALYGILGA